MDKVIWHLWHTFDTVWKKRTPLFKNTTLQKWHPTSMASHNYFIGYLKYYQFKTLLIEQTLPIRHRKEIRIPFWTGRNLILKPNVHESESWSTFKNFLLKITHLNPWKIAITFGHFFARCVFFVRCHYFQMALKDAILFGFIWWLLKQIIYCFTSSLKRD